MTTPLSDLGQYTFPPSPPPDGVYAQSDDYNCPANHNVAYQTHRTIRLNVIPGFDDICQVDEESIRLMVGCSGTGKSTLASQNVEMFSNARDVSIRNSEINNVGGDLTVNNYNVCLPEPSSTWNHWIQPFLELESERRVSNKKSPSRRFSAMASGTVWQARGLRCSPLLNAIILLGRTTLYKPGVMNYWWLSTFRYSFYGG